MKCKTVRIFLLSALFAAVCSIPAHATPVVVPDFSFENTPLGPGGASGASSVGTNWSASGNGGVFLQSLTNTFFDPTGSNTLPATADGTNYLDLNINGHTGYCWQDIGPLESNTTYTLTIAVGQSLFGYSGQGFIALVNGSSPFQTVIASAPVDSSVVPSGTFTDTSLVFTTGHQVSGPLTILMEGTNGQQILFDNVRLDATPTPNSPTALPPSLSTPSSTVYVGAPVTLTENAAGNAPFTYQWQTDNGSAGASFTAVPNATNTSFAVDTSGFTANSSVEYRVIVNNSLGGSTSAPVTLTAIQGPPIVTQQTLPSSGSDVEGSSITFTAVVDGSRPLALQWMVDTGSGPAPIPGATNSSLTVSNLQVSDTGSYSLQGSNSFGVISSSPSTFIVNPVPSDVNGVIISTANQLGLGGPTIFTPTWTLATNSLIGGMLPSTNAGNFRLEGAGGIPPLTDGRFGSLDPEGNASIDVATCGVLSDNAGYLLTYTLPASANGWDITNIISYGGWSDAGRDEQEYSVYYSTSADPTSFGNLMTSVDYLPDDPNAFQSATRLNLTATNGVLAHNVAAVEFFFNLLAKGPENGYEGYAEFQIFGAPSAPKPIIVTNTEPSTASDVVGSSVTFIAAVNSTQPLSYQWQVDTGSGPQNVPGATSQTLTLNNLQFSDAGSYRLVASNALGMVVTTPGVLTVNQAPAPDSFNVLEAVATQTENGPTLAPTWTVAPGSLISGFFPSAVTPGANNFSAESSGGLPILTDGSIGFTGGGINTTLATCGANAGQTITYTLTGSGSGYTLSNIVVYGGWSDGGRDEQAYTISYSTVTDPGTFTELTSYDFLPTLPGAVPNMTRITYTAGSGALATNVAKIMFDFTNPNNGGENGYEGYSEIDLYGAPSPSVTAPPYLTSDTLPATGSDVVGSQVSFTAAFSSSSPISYQWMKDTGSGPAPIAGATTPTLTLANLQLSDTASYSLVASNALGQAGSSPSAFTVNSAPLATNGAVVAKANQTCSGVVFTPTWPAAPASLIAGEAPGASAGNYANGGAVGTAVLTDGKFGPIGGNDDAALASGGVGAGTTITYPLPGSASGYDLTEIVTYGGWNDSGRDEQHYTVYYATAAAPTNFIAIASPVFNPTVPAGQPSADRITITSGTSDPLAKNAVAVKFDFTNPTGENGWSGYSELDIVGAPSSAPSVLSVHSTLLENGKLVLTGAGGTPGAGYTWLSSTNVAAPLSSWVTNSAGVFDSSGAFSNAIPVTGSPAANFFILRTP